MRVNNASVRLQDLKTNFTMILIVICFFVALLGLLFRSSVVVPQHKSIDEYGAERHKQIKQDWKKVDEFRP